ncbi:type I restriction-modification system subunit M N-terminal domain-containing protein [Sneathia vaginalis]
MCKALDCTLNDILKKIWNVACVLLGHIPATEYRKVIVELIFLRYISSAKVENFIHLQVL